MVSSARLALSPVQNNPSYSTHEPSHPPRYDPLLVLDSASSHSSPASPSASAGEAAHDDVDQRDAAADDSLEDGADAVNDGHDASTDGAEDGFEL